MAGDTNNLRRPYRPASAVLRAAKPWFVALLTGGASACAWAQNPASDMDNWIQFPPRPRPSQAQPEPRQTPPTTTPKSAPPPTVSTTNERDNWIRFPIRPSAPVAVELPPTQNAQASTQTPAKETSKSAEQDPKAKRNEVPSTGNRLAGFKIKGNERITDALIQTELRHLIGNPLTQENLQKATDKVIALYQKNGYLAVAEMPPQDLTSGWAEIKVVEAKFAGTVIEDPQGQLANTRLPIDMVEHVQPKGALVSLAALDKAAALMAEIPGVETKISLRPGETVGETQAVASILPGKPIDASVSVDNAGTKATGEVRESAKVTLNNPLKMGDSASAQLLHSEGIDYKKFSYTVPIGAAGWRAGVNTSSMQYKVITPEFEALNAKGPSSTTGVELTIPWVRENFDNVSLQLAYDQKKFKNEAIDVVQSQYTGNAFTAYLEGSHNNGRGGETSASAQWVNGVIDLSGSTPAHQANDAATTRTDGHYNKLRVALTHKQDINPANTVVISGQSQWASKNLDGSERFFLGGMQGVRAYPTSEGGGSVGHLLSMEWQRHFNLNQNKWTTAGFFDTGRVTVNKNNQFTNAASPNQYSLSGAGVWLGTSVRNAYGISTLRLVAARRLGNNPGASTNGMDQDGSRVLNRYRFSLNHSF